MYILVIIVLGLCLWYISNIQEGAKDGKNKKKKRRASAPTDEGAILNEKMDAILALEDRINAIEETLKLNSNQIKDVIIPQLTSIIG
jgi:hypothetical protein